MQISKFQSGGNLEKNTFFHRAPRLFHPCWSRRGHQCRHLPKGPKREGPNLPTLVNKYYFFCFERSLKSAKFFFYLPTWFLQKNKFSCPWLLPWQSSFYFLKTLSFTNCLFVCLFIEGPLSGITLSSQNAGSEELTQCSVPDVLQCGESTVPAWRFLATWSTP